MEVGNLVALFQNFLSVTDNTERKTYEATIINELKDPRSVWNLLYILKNEEVNEGVRHLASVLLRKKSMFLWRTATFEQQEELKIILLDLLGSLTHRPLQLAVTHVIAVIAKVAVDHDSDWDALNKQLIAGSESPNPNYRELCMILIYSISETIGANTKTTNAILSALTNGLKDSEMKVKESALKALESSISYLDGRSLFKEKFFKTILPDILSVIQSVTPETYCTSLQCMDVLDKLVEQLHTKTDYNVLVDLMQFLIAAMRHPQCPPRIREYSAEIMAKVAESKHRFMKISCLAPSIIDSAFSCLCEQESLGFDRPSEDNDERSINYKTSSLYYGGYVLNALSLSLPEKTVGPHVLQLAAAVHTPLEQRAAIVALASIAEGCSSLIRKKLSSIVNLISTLAQSPTPECREAAAFSIEYFCEHLVPEISIRTSELLTVMVPLLSDPADSVRMMAAKAIDSICDNAGKDIDPLLPALISVLIDSLASSSSEIQVHICGAIASIAATEAPSYKQFGEQILDLLKIPLSQPDVSSQLKSKAIEAAGLTAGAIGKEKFRSYFEFFVTKALTNFEFDTPEMKENSFSFFSNLSILREELSPFFPQIMHLLRESIVYDPTVEENCHPLSMMPNFDIGEDEEAVPDAKDIRLTITEAAIEEKKAAIYALGCIASNLRETIGHHIPDMVNLITPGCTGHFDAGIRGNSMVCLARIAVAALGTHEVAPGLLLNDAISKLNGDILNILLDSMLNDSDKVVVKAACDGLGIIVSFYGSQLGIDFKIPSEVLTSLLKRDAACQDSDDDDIDHEDIGDGRDFTLTESVCNAIEEIAKALKGDFLPLLQDPIGSALKPYLSTKRTTQDVISATGLIASIAGFLKGAAASIFDEYMPIILGLLSSCDESAVKANCCFSIKNFIESCPELFSCSDRVNRIMEYLAAVAMSPDEIPFARDNAASAASSLIRYQPNLVPTVSITHVLKFFPLQADHDENSNGISLLEHLLIHRQNTFTSAGGEEAAAACTEAIRGLFSSSCVTDKMKERLVMVLKQCQSLNFSLFQLVVKNDILSFLE